MPKVKYGKKTFILRWLPAWDKQLLAVGDHYIYNKNVRWQLAEVEGALKGLPDIPLTEFSKRYGHLNRMQNPVYREKRLASSLEYNRVHNVKSGDRKQERFDIIKKKQVHGYPFKEVWTARQVKTLLALVERYRKSEKCVDWARLVRDPGVKRLPLTSKKKLISYYWSNTVSVQDLVKKRRAMLQYKKDNYEKYLVNQKRRQRRVREKFNELMLSQVKIRRN